MYLVFILITVLHAASAVAALFTVLKPGVSERTRQIAIGVLTTGSLVAAITYLASGHVIPGTMFAAFTALFLITWWQVLRGLAHRIWARRGNRSTK